MSIILVLIAIGVYIVWNHRRNVRRWERQQEDQELYYDIADGVPYETYLRGKVSGHELDQQRAWGVPKLQEVRSDLVRGHSGELLPEVTPIERMAVMEALETIYNMESAEEPELSVQSEAKGSDAPSSGSEEERPQDS